MENISATRLQEVIPELRRRIYDLDQKLDAIGIHIRVVQGYRTYAQQAELYNQGRTTPGAIVTNAKPMDSAHVYGLAVDCVPDVPGLPNWQPDWNSRDSRWQGFLDIAATCGLAEGATWRGFPDAPHLYLYELPADPDDMLKSLLASGGTQAVWDWVNETYHFKEE